MRLFGTQVKGALDNLLFILLLEKNFIEKMLNDWGWALAFTFYAPHLSFT